MREEIGTMRSLVAILAMLLPAACSDKQDAAPQPQASASPAAAAAPSTPAAPPAQARKVEVQNALIQFDYAYPAEAAAIPALKGLLDADLDKRQREITAEAQEGRAEAKQSGYDFNPYGHSTDWTVVTDLPGWLSLTAQRWEFTGGAHGNPWTEALLWDKAASARRKTEDLFVSKAALSSAIRLPFCDLLDKERARRREAPVNRDSGDMFDECIDPLESTVILGSADKQHFTRIGVQVDPYAAGPYAEGGYEVTLPVTPAVLRAVKPEYRALFAAGR